MYVLQGRIQDFFKRGGGSILGLQAKKKGAQKGVQLWAECSKAYIVGQKGGSGPPGPPPPDPPMLYHDHSVRPSGLH